MLSNPIFTAPIFTADDVAHLVSAVQRTLEHLREANERVGGKDPQLMETGRRYALLLQKLETVGHSQ